MIEFKFNLFKKYNSKFTYYKVCLIGLMRRSDINVSLSIVSTCTPILSYFLCHTTC